MPSQRIYRRKLCSDSFAIPLYIDDMGEKGLNRIDFLVQILHHSANSFTNAIQSHELAWEGAQLAKAWIGVDVHAWHKHLAYQAAVYALLQTAIGSWIRHYNDHERDHGLVQKILLPRISALQDHVEHQLNSRNRKLVEWFKKEQLPVLAGTFTPSLRKLSADYEESGAAVIILAISCCLAIRKCTRRISFPLFTSSIPELVAKFMNLLQDLFPLDKLHKLASVAGFEHEFLIHYGSNAPYCDASEDGLFWMGLVHRKLILAFQREGLVANLEDFYDPKILESEMAILGLFAYLGKKTRVFLSYMGIKDLDEPVKDFLRCFPCSYLECGSLFIYPALSSVSVYQHFVEVVTEEIGWFKFYTAVPSVRCQVRRRTKQHAIQAEKEIIFSTVFKVCSDVFLRFAHFSKSTHQPLSPKLVTFLLRSQNMLNICLEDYWVSYDGSTELQSIGGRETEEVSVGKHEILSSVTSIEEIQQNPIELRTEFELVSKCMAQFCEVSGGGRKDEAHSKKVPSAKESKVVSQRCITKYIQKLISTSLDVYIGTQLLFVDISVAVGFLWNQVCGQTLTRRERNKLRRTLADVASVIPVAIIMLLPLSAVGHAAIFAAIKKYAPGLIPSTYSSARLDVIKQLKRTKEMELQPLSNLEVSSL
ncbi:hypothetical protein H6P81_009146 [Aristolochia fimbriata]|uniref:Letm1 RBD domain-containing protein n=1 Tax=Aristolochia fimbriata TaxID=158543 RepID=A0AAV7EL88_ARIFI|nr:hypothetical protein H6P81_009146 [Aristolochia fimbriata]